MNRGSGIHTICLKIANYAKYMDALDERTTIRNCANIVLKFNLNCDRANQTIANRDKILGESTTMVVGTPDTMPQDVSFTKNADL